MKRSNQMMDYSVAKYGDLASFDGKNIRYLPSAETVASKSPEELKTEAKLGYRAQNLIEIAKVLTQGFPSMDDLYKMDPLEAKQKLLELRGLATTLLNL